LSCADTAALARGSGDDVQVHLFSLRRLAALLPPADILLARLDAGERAAFERIRSPQRRAEVLHGRVMLRRLLASRGGIDEHAVVLVRDAGAKPRACAADGAWLPSFNVSHAGDCLAIALARAGEIGVDVEPAGRCGAPGIDAEAIAQRHFAPAERSLIAAAPPGERPALFLRLWTLKEAVLKAAGTGLCHPLDGIDMSAPGARQAARVARDGQVVEVEAAYLSLAEPAVHLAVARACRLGKVTVVRDERPAGAGGAWAAAAAAAAAA